jgi:hypothetical protein
MEGPPFPLPRAFVYRCASTAEGAMMALLVRGLLALSGAAAAIFVAQDAPNFGVVQGMLALVAAVAVLVLLGLSGRR